MAGIVYSAMPRIAVFCGSRAGNDPAYGEAAAALGRALAGRGCELVYGGAHVGLMGIAADAVLAQGGRVTGVIPTSMVDRELAHRGITDLRIVASMHERKALMASLADAFLVLPGGMGTLDELCEILTWAQLGLHAKPVGLLDVRDYWRGFLAFLDTAVAEGFLRSGDRARLHVPDGCRGAGGRPARGRVGAGVKTLLAQLRLMFDAPAPAPLAPSRCTGTRPGQARPRARCAGARSELLAPRLVRHPRARQYVLRLLPDGTPRVTIPRWGSKREALAFLEAQHDWVARQRAAQVARAQIRPSRDWRDGHEVLLGGSAVALRRGSAARAGVVEQDGTLVVTPRPRDGDDLRPVASAWLRARATRALPPRLLTLAARFELTVTHVSVRNQRARWGSCATGGRISLNWRLIQTPDDVRDYVLIHELMHLRQPNHSARFWALVARACPGHEASRRWLRAHEAALLDAR